MWRILGDWIALSAAFLLMTVCSSPAQAADRPNVLLIISEDNGPQFGCYGDITVPTPAVDGLAAAGVRFRHAYVTQAVCSPSRASIYTGLYPHQNGQIGLATHKFTTVGNPPNLPQLLQTAGYRTGLIGKLHVLPEANFTYDFRWADPQVVSFSHRNVKRTAEVAGEFMKEGKQPFFLTVCFADAHLPFLPQHSGEPPQPLTAKDVQMWPEVGVDTERLRGHLANYYNCIQRLDTGIGHLLKELESTGQADNTVVIYVGDHGPQFARGKVTSYELGLKVPLIVRDPRSKASPAVRDELVSTVDLMPTILQAAKVEPPKHLPGQSLLPLLAGPDKDFRQYLCCEWNVSHTPMKPFPQRTIRDARYKLILNVMPGERNPAEEYYTEQTLVETGPTQAEIDAASPAVQAMYATWRKAPPVELYDLQTDPQEGVNLAGKAEVAAVQARLRKELQAWREATDDPFLDEGKLAMFIEEHAEQGARVKTEGRKAYLPWRYPDYFYSK